MPTRQQSIARLKVQIAEAERKIKATTDAIIINSQRASIHTWSVEIQRIEENIRRDPTQEERQAEDLRHYKATKTIIAKDPTGIKRS